MDGGKTVVWGNPGNGAAKDREIQILLRGTRQLPGRERTGDRGRTVIRDTRANKARG